MLHALRRGFSTTATEFSSEAAYLDALASRAVLPRGFRCGAHTFQFSPAELANKRANMTLTLLSLDKPTPSFAAMFTTNAFPGAPVLVGRERVATAPALAGAVPTHCVARDAEPNAGLLLWQSLLLKERAVQDSGAQLADAQ